MRVRIAIAGAFTYVLLYSVLTGLILYTDLDLSERFLVPSFDLYTTQETFVVMFYPTSHLILCFPLVNILFIGLISILVGANLFTLVHRGDSSFPVRFRFSLFLIGAFLAFFTNEGLCGYPFLYALAPNISVALSKNTSLFMWVSSSLLLLNPILTRAFRPKK